MRFFFDQLREFAERYRELGREYTDQELDAGVEELEAFGDFAMVLNYARSMHITADEAVATAADVVYMTLLHDKKVGEYRERLEEIMRDSPPAGKQMGADDDDDSGA